MRPKLLIFLSIRSRVHFLTSTIYCDISPIAFSIQLLIQMAFRHKYRNHGKKAPQYPSDGLVILWACRRSSRRRRCVGEERARWCVADFSSFKTATAFNMDPSNWTPLIVSVGYRVRMFLLHLLMSSCWYVCISLICLIIVVATVQLLCLRSCYAWTTAYIVWLLDRWLCISLFVRCYLAPWKEWSWYTLDTHWQFLSSELFVQVHGRVQLGYHSHRYR